MFSPDQYELLDFGEGRKLERFGPYVLDRPAPTAEGFARRLSAGHWRQAFARYERTDAERGRWVSRFPLPSTWCIAHGDLTFEIKPTASGQVGIFPEQAANWDWIGRQVRAGGPMKILNLFAYTGGSTLAAAAAGAAVTHVDAAESAIDWARQNAGLSGLADAPIRWIVDDAERFARRELKRGNQYDALILDPPTYGHGPHGEVWKLADHLATLLGLCAELTAANRRFLLLTCHATGINAGKLRRFLDDVAGGTGVVVESEALVLRAVAGERMPSGVVARWTAGRGPTLAAAP